MIATETHSVKSEEPEGAESPRKVFIPAHVEDLRRSDLSAETIRDAGIYSESDHLKLGMILNFRYPKSRGPALVFPFRDLDGNLNGYKRVKPSIPGKDRDGKSVKYLSPKGSKNRAYFPGKVMPLLSESSVELLIVEGEKKALKCSQEGIPAIGLIGVYGWKEGRKADRLVPDLEAVTWQGRRALICFDSDIADKPEVKEAASRLAAQLTARGAVVKMVVLPNGPNGDKQGADDFLIAKGLTEFRKLLDSAVDPEPLGKDAGKVAADLLDPMDEIRRFIERNAMRGDELTLRAYRGSYQYHNGKKYTEQDGDYIKSLLYRFLDPFARFITRSVVGNLLAALQAQVIVPATTEQPSWIDKRGRAQDFVAMENGILSIPDLLSGKSNVLTPHTPLWFSTVCLPYQFDPAATCPKWIASLTKNLDGDLKRIAILQEMLGYCLTQDTSMQKFLVLSGEGGTGKSSACAGITATLGTENVSHLPLETFGVRFQTYSTLGKLANIAADGGEIDKVAEGTLKSFTSGDRMDFERKFHDPVSAMPTARLILATNNLPRFSDRSSGIWRRMIVMPFRSVVLESEKVRGMDKPDWWREQGELPGIFNWAIEGLRRLRENKRFTESEECERELAQYRMECNPAQMFLRDEYVEDPQGDVATGDVYAAYSKWCAVNNHHRLASNTFGKEIVRLFKKATPTKVYANDGRRVPGYAGIKSIPANPDSGDF